eukprot:snap_masked-scaffold_21-processed-gene-2.13-mRNA-1 protein AED:1.00 eAED:1.00 QI:0/0/0/0/1/1/2/0/69
MEKIKEKSKIQSLLFTNYNIPEYNSFPQFSSEQKNKVNKVKFLFILKIDLIQITPNKSYLLKYWKNFRK